MISGIGIIGPSGGIAPTSNIGKSCSSSASVASRRWLEQPSSSRTRARSRRWVAGMTAIRY